MLNIVLLRQAHQAQNTDTTPGDEEETGYSAAVMYNFGAGDKWQIKGAYSKLNDVKVSGANDRLTEKDVWSTQLMYSIDSNAVLYGRYRDLTFSAADGSAGPNSFKEGSLGIEYWF